MGKKSRITVSGIIDDARRLTTNIARRLEMHENSSEFPYECLPPQLQRYVIGMHESQGLIIDFMASCLLVVTASIIGKSLSIRAKQDWVEPTILYMCLVGRSGVGKTPPLKTILSHLEHLDYIEYKKYEQEYQAWEARTKELRRSKEADKDIIEPPPKRKRRIISDATMESICRIHRENPNGLIKVHDEFMAFINSFNRYAKSSTERQNWLSNFDGGSMFVDRKTDDYSIVIEKSNICVVGTIQDELLHAILDDNGDDGLIYRLLLAISHEGGMQVWWNWTEVSADIKDIWTQCVDMLINRTDERRRTYKDMGVMLELSNDARKVMYDWQKTCVEQLNRQRDSTLMSIQSKLQGYAMRLCTVLYELYAVYSDDKSYIVNEDIARYAVSLIEYYRSNTLYALGMMSRSAMNSNEQDVYDALPEKFTTEEAYSIAQDICQWEQRKMRRYLKAYDNKLFVRVSHGHYKKILNE